jgi:MFS family permease
MDTATMTASAWRLLTGMTVATLLASAGQITLATLSGIVGAQLAPAPNVATLPLAAVVVGVALTTMPTALLIARWGRRAVFIGGLLWASAGALLSAYAISSDSFALFCAGSFMLGGNMAVVAQYRFAVADSMPAAFVSRALGALMLGTLGAAVITPWLILQYRNWLAVEFTGSFVILPAVFVPAAIVFMVLPLDRGRADAAQAEAASATAASHELTDLLRRRDVQLAVTAATVGFGVMTLLMTATPVSMHIMDGHSVTATAAVIQWHVIAMYAPSLFSGWLIARLGIARMLWAGLACESLAIAVALSGQEVLQYRVALILLGLGWNLLFIGGTTLLATTVRGAAAARLRAANETIMFGTTALCSLAAGVLLAQLGWAGMNTAAVVLLAALAVSLLRARVGSPIASAG